MKNKNSSHEFAIFVPALSASNQEYELTDSILYHRIVRVLRLQEADSAIFFNRNEHQRVTIKRVNHKSLTILGSDKKANQIFTPSITFLLPLLKKEAFEQAIYGLVEAGISEIQPIITQKMHRKWGGERDMNRLERIIIGAAEQSKCYHFAQLHEPKPFSDSISERDNLIYFDPDGKPISQIIKSVDKKKDLSLLVGPEGGLAQDETELLKTEHICIASLTPTILRAHQAAFAASVIMRSFLN